MDWRKLLVVGALLATSSGIAHAALYSGFNTSVEGWTTVGATAPTFSLSGGNPGGFIYATDVTGSPSFADFGWGFFSPSSWSGDWGAYAGGSVAFDLAPLGYSASGATLALLSGRNYAYAFVNGPLNNGSWSSFQTSLTASNFTSVGATFQQILKNVTQLYIDGDKINGTETTGLDNVTVSAVPLPASIWLLFSGLSILAVSLRRRVV
jgi:hypothetical protein